MSAKNKAYSLRWWKKWAMAGANGSCKHKRMFSFAAIMSVVTQRLLASSLDEIADLLQHLVGSETLGNTALYARAQNQLFRQYPVLNDGEMQYAQDKLSLMLETESGRAETEKLMLGWLATQSVRLGMNLDSPISVEGL